MQLGKDLRASHFAKDPDEETFDPGRPLAPSRHQSDTARVLIITIHKRSECAAARPKVLAFLQSKLPAAPEDDSRSNLIRSVDGDDDMPTLEDLVYSERWPLRCLSFLAPLSAAAAAASDFRPWSDAAPPVATLRSRLSTSCGRIGREDHELRCSDWTLVSCGLKPGLAEVIVLSCSCSGTLTCAW